jgi:tetratricopeptide (TPR) repeat protein
MNVKSTDWTRRNQLLDEVVDLPVAQRPAWLAALQLREPAHAAVVTKMLADFENATDGAPQPTNLVGVGANEFAASLATATAANMDEKNHTLDMIGPWQLSKKIGQGGMGAVWLATRQDGNFSGMAAIKFIHTSLGKTEVLNRFLRERRLLARLTHPNIARLIDAGTHIDAPYLVMEYVDGIAITDWARQHAPMVAERIQLILKVCRAVEYAHTQLIVHRDLKPSNVLVNSRGEPSLLDFGIAKLIDDDADDDNTALTRLTGRGYTLGYCAPEQITGETTGVAADVFSIGVLLFELLTGVMPFQADGRAAMEHAIVHTEAKSIARTLNDLVDSTTMRSPVDAIEAKGDLDAIVAKALRKKPSDRYATVGAFAADLERWLNNLPVDARRGDWRYKTTLWFKRNRTLAAVTTVAFIAVSGGLIAAIWQAERASMAAIRANAEATRADIEREAAVEQRRRAEIATAQTAAALAESKLAQQVADHNAIDARRSAQRAIVAAQDSQRSLSLANDANRRTESAKQFLAGMFDRKRFERFEPGKRGEFPVKELLAQSAEDLRNAPMTPDLKSELLVEAANLFRNIDDDPSALAAAREALTLAMPLKKSNPTAYRRAAISLLAASDPALQSSEAKQLLSGLISELERDHQTHTDAYATALVYRGEMLQATKGPTGDGRADINRAAMIFAKLGQRTDEAQMRYRWAYMTDLGGDTAAALPEFAKAIAIYQSIGESGSKLAQVELSLANALRRSERIDEAMTRYESAIAINTRVLGNTHSSTLNAKLAYGFVLVNYGHQSRGITMITEAYEATKKQNFPALTIHRAGSTLARAMVGEGDPAKIMQLSSEARAYYRANQRNAGELSNLETMAQAALFSENFAEALKLADEADALAELTYGKMGIQRDVTRVMKAFVMTVSKHPDALQFIEQTIKTVSATTGISSNKVLLACYRAEALVRLGRFTDAEIVLSEVSSDAQKDGMRLAAIYYLAALELARARNDTHAIIPLLEKILLARIKGNGVNSTQTQMSRLALATELINQNRSDEARSQLHDIPDTFITTNIAPAKTQSLASGITLLNTIRSKASQR